MTNKILIVIEGGVLQSVYAAQPEEGALFVIDYDSADKNESPVIWHGATASQISEQNLQSMIDVFDRKFPRLRDIDENN